MRHGLKARFLLPTAADWRHKMDLAVFTDALGQVECHFTIHGNHEVRSQITTLEEVLAVVKRRPAGQHVVITGRDAPQELIDFADLVTEMREIKHPFAAGVKAQKGIEF